VKNAAVSIIATKTLHQKNWIIGLDLTEKSNPIQKFKESNFFGFSAIDLVENSMIHPIRNLKKVDFQILVTDYKFSILITRGMVLFYRSVFTAIN
jgi:hypothetical protein